MNDDLYIYDVPKLSPDGVCSATSEKDPKPYDLGQVIGRNERQTLRLKRLNSIVEDLAKRLKLDWVGIYFKGKNVIGEEVLIKHAYRGAISRAEFPLTKDFMIKSNNTTVALTGSAVLINDLSAHKGPYYQCDAKVKSEFCCPIISNCEVTGIIDAESFVPNFFDKEKVREIEKVCKELGDSN